MRGSLVRLAALSTSFALAGLGLGATAGSVGPPPPPSPAVPLVLGVSANTQGLGAKAGPEQDQARRAGARWLREDLAWDVVQPRRRGRLNWARYDRVIGEAARRGLRVLPVIDAAPAWAAPTPETVPTDPAAYAAFTARVTARYGPGGTFWRARPELDGRLAPGWFELWNEPYFHVFNPDGPDPARYGRLFRDAARAGRAANPRARFLLGADIAFYGPDGARSPWLEPMLAGVPGLAEETDAIAVHPYLPGSPYAFTASPRDDIRRILLAREAFAGRPGGPPPVWATELGWSTCTTGGGCVSPAAQARHLGELLDLLREPPYAGVVQAAFVYRLRDLEGTPRDRERSFGLLKRDGRPKPAWRVLRRAAGAR